MADEGKAPTLEVRALQFSYAGQAPFVSDLSLSLSPGSRCLLIGANGAGKTTLLRIFAGKHLVGGKDVVRVLGRSAFHDTSLTCSGELAYLGESWSRPIGSAGDVPLQGDFTAEHMIFGVEGIDPERRQRLIDLLDINLQWKMHKVSDGQRRRVQICMGLLKPYKVLLLDEITVDLDVVGRMDLLQFFIEECSQRGCTIVYATHIFDGLETWATHTAYVVDVKKKKSRDKADILDLLTLTGIPISEAGKRGNQSLVQSEVAELSESHSGEAEVDHRFLEARHDVYVADAAQPLRYVHLAPLR